MESLVCSVVFAEDQLALLIFDGGNLDCNDRRGHSVASRSHLFHFHRFPFAQLLHAVVHLDGLIDERGHLGCVRLETRTMFCLEIAKSFLVVLVYF